MPPPHGHAKLSLYYMRRISSATSGLGKQEVGHAVAARAAAAAVRKVVRSAAARPTLWLHAPHHAA